MKQVAVLVEGQTEEQFVDGVLQPYVNPGGLATGCWLQPIVVATSRTPSGRKSRGGGSWANYNRDLKQLLAQRHWDKVGLLVDMYGYPADAPGAGALAVGRERHRALLAALAKKYPDPRFVPGIALHEFETWVVAAALGGGDLLGESEPAQRLRSLAAEFDNDVELIDGGVKTSPSKRVAALWPRYSKTIDGIEAIRVAGLERVLSHCPSLSAWLARLMADG